MSSRPTPSRPQPRAAGGDPQTARPSFEGVRPALADLPFVRRMCDDSWLQGSPEPAVLTHADRGGP